MTSTSFCHAVDSAPHNIDDYLCFSYTGVAALRRRHSSCCLRADLHTSRPAVLTQPGGLGGGSRLRGEAAPATGGRRGEMERRRRRRRSGKVGPHHLMHL